MEMVFKHGLMEVDMREYINKEKKMDRENIYGKMEVSIMEVGKIIK